MNNCGQRRDAEEGASCWLSRSGGIHAQTYSCLRTPSISPLPQKRTGAALSPLWQSQNTPLSNPAASSVTRLLLRNLIASPARCGRLLLVRQCPQPPLGGRLPDSSTAGRLLRYRVTFPLQPKRRFSLTPAHWSLSPQLRLLKRPHRFALPCFDTPIWSNIRSASQTPPI